MSQKAKAGNNLIQVARDYIRTIEINILRGEINFPIVAQLFRYLKKLFEKDKIINNLKNELKEKEREIEFLQKTSEQGIEQLIEAQNKMQEAISIAQNLSKKASEIGLHDESLAILNQLNQLCLSLDQHNKRTEPYLKASLWVMRRINEWAEEATKIVTEEGSTDLTPEEIRPFSDDIYKYINWLQESMLYAKPLRQSLTELNNSRNILQPHPYRKAFQHIKSLVKAKDMPLEEVYALHKMIDFLIKNI